MTTTPNPTAEQVIDRALKDHKGRYHPVNERTAAFIEDELLYFGLLSEGAPSEDQIERAARAAVGVLVAEFDGTDAPFDEADIAQALGMQRKAQRAALAAAGAAPVLPSSGVDEDKLAEAWEAGCLAGKNRKHHTNMTEEQAEKAWPNPYRAGKVDTRG